MNYDYRNTWPGGIRHAMDPDEHERWNACNYPGTLQLCCECEEPTGRCDEDELCCGEEGPFCEDCYHALVEEANHNNELARKGRMK